MMIAVLPKLFRNGGINTDFATAFGFVLEFYNAINQRK